MHLSLRLAFARTDCTPHDTLCTYGAKQLKLLGFSQRHLFGCSLMVAGEGFEPPTSGL